MIILSILFFITAILYSSVGFGGGSTYLALLLIWDTPYYIFPIIALFCNIIVVTGNSINYIRAGNHNLKLLIPFLIGSIPLSFLGGTLIINKETFELFFSDLKVNDQIYKIFKLRYLEGSKNKLMPWREVGKQLNLSIQGCINIHDRFLKKIKKLKKYDK